MRAAAIEAQPTLDLLSFAVGGVAFAVDAATVAAVAFAADAAVASHERGEGEADDLFWFDEEIGYGRANVTYRTPVVLSIRNHARPYRVVVDELREVASVGLDAISPLPALVEPLALRRGIWGTFWHEGGMVLLVDFLRLPNCAAKTDFLEND